MKTYKTIPQDEALARMQNWVIGNLKLTIEQLAEASNKIRYSIKGERALTDLAYFIQWAYVQEIEYLELLETVVLDLKNGPQPEYKMKSMGFADVYNHHTKHISRNELTEVKEVAIITAILSNEFSTTLLERGHSYISTMEKLADTAQTVFYNQSQKPKDMDWMDYVEQLNLASWDEWVLEQGSQILELKNKAA